MNNVKIGSKINLKVKVHITDPYFLDNFFQGEGRAASIFLFIIYSQFVFVGPNFQELADLIYQKLYSYLMDL